MTFSVNAQCPDLNICITDPTPINPYEYEFDLFLTSAPANYTAIQINTSVIFDEDVEISSTLYSLLDNAGWNVYAGSNNTGVLNPDETNQNVTISLTQDDLLSVTYEAPPNDHTISISVNAFRIDDNGQSINCTVTTCADVLVEPDVYEISGDVDKFGSDCSSSSNHDLPDVTVNYYKQSDLNNAICGPVTGSQGLFSCDVLGDGDYRVVPEREAPVDCDLDDFDVYMIQAHILGLDCLDDEWQVIAADADLNNLIQGSDIVEVRRAYLGIESLDQQWRFIEAQTYSQMNLNCAGSIPAFNEYVDIDDIQSNQSISFGGIKVGDVDGQCSDCSGLTGGSDDDPDTTIYVTDSYQSTGINTYEVFIKPSQKTRLNQWYADIEIDGASSISIKDEESWHTNAFVSNNPTSDRIRLHFLSDTTGTNFRITDELVTLEVTATSAPTNVSFNDSFQAGAFDGKGKLELQLQ